MPCRFASSGTVATSRSASRAILALNVASNFLRDLVISVLHPLRQSRTLHTLTFGPISGVHFNPRLRRAVAGKLRLDWSPEQIAGWLKRTHPGDECNQVSHETIYRSLFVQARGVLKKELLGHLRSKRSMRRSRPVDPNGDKRGHIKDIVSIRQRPAAVEDRAVPGH